MKHEALYAAVKFLLEQYVAEGTPIQQVGREQLAQPHIADLEAELVHNRTQVGDSNVHVVNSDPSVAINED